MKPFLILGIIISLWACESEQAALVEQPEQSHSIAISEQQLKGEWKWVETTYHLRGMQKSTTVTPPANTVITYQIDANTVKIIQNGIPLASLDYVLTESDGIIHISIDYKHQPIHFHMEQGPISLEGNRLLIAGGYNDAGGSQVLERVK